MLDAATATENAASHAGWPRLRAVVVDPVLFVSSFVAELPPTQRHASETVNRTRQAAVDVWSRQAQCVDCDSL